MEKIEFDLGNLQSRDEIPKLLMGIQTIHENKISQKAIFQILEELVPKGINPSNGRKGMDLWKIIVLGMLGLNWNIDFYKLHELRIVD